MQQGFAKVREKRRPVALVQQRRRIVERVGVVLGGGGVAALHAPRTFASRVLPQCDHSSLGPNHPRGDEKPAELNRSLLHERTWWPRNPGTCTHLVAATAAIMFCISIRYIPRARAGPLVGLVFEQAIELAGLHGLCPQHFHSAIPQRRR